MNEQCATCIAVLEAGAEWQPQLWGLQGRVDDSVVIRQRPDESEAQLLKRLDETCAGLATSGTEVHTAVFACREPQNASGLGCNVQLVARLLAKLTVGPGARLVLVTEKGRGSAVNGLLALAGTMIERWVSGGIRVELCAGSYCARAGLVRTQRPPWPTTLRREGPGLARAGRARRSVPPDLRGTVR